MPGDWIDSAECAESPCRASVDLRKDVAIISVIPAFDCSACGETSPVRYRFGPPLTTVKCVNCPADQDPRPPSFTIAVVGDRLLRVRCDVCGHTWEGEEFASGCPSCEAGAA